MEGDARLILAGGLLLAIGIAASLLAGRIRIPLLVVLLAAGMLIGSDGLGIVDFSNYELAQKIGVIALALILYEGGLTAGYHEVLPVLRPAIALALIGSVLTAIVTGIAYTALFGGPWLLGLLVGAVLCSTDGAAIFALLRGSSLKPRLARTLEAEAGFNDPIAVLLVLATVAALGPDAYDAAGWIKLFVEQLGIGLIVGVVVGVLAVEGFQRAELSTQGLYPVASIAAAGIAYGGANVLHGSGFLAVYIVGLALGGASIPAKRTVVSFQVGLAWVAQLAMFLMLGLLVNPSQLAGVALKGTIVALVLTFIARPVATFLSTIGAGFSVGDRVVLSWAGLRGAVPVVLATFPVTAGVAGGREIFGVVFFAVFISTVLQGTTFERLAAYVGATSPQAALPVPLAEAGSVRRLGAEVHEFTVGPDDAIVGARIRDLDLPREAVVNLIVRDTEAVPPRGSTRIRAGDELHVLVRREQARSLRELLERWRTGPIGPSRRPVPSLGRTATTFATWPWGERDGDPAAPDSIQGRAPIEQLRRRRDTAGGLWLLEDGAYAVTGPLAAIGAREDLIGWASRRMGFGDEDERSWMSTVVGALSVDRHSRARERGAAPPVARDNS